MTQHVRPGAALAGPRLTRRVFLGLSAGVGGGLAVPAWPALAAGTGAGVVPWIDRHAVPLSGTDPRQPAGELSHLRGVVRGAAIVGLGEPAHGTHTQLRLKHRVARYLVENLGFRTIAWEEGWAAGSRSTGTSPAVVATRRPSWATPCSCSAPRPYRSWSAGCASSTATTPDHDKVRSLGADVLELPRSSSTRSDDTSPRSRRTGARSWGRTWRRSTGAATRSPSSAGTPS
jgi:erythromycin esterase